MKVDLTIHIYARAAKANKSGLHPIYVRITLNGKRSEFSTRKYVDPKKWDEKTMRVKGNTEEARTLNSYLETIRTQITQLQMHFQYQAQEVTITQFMDTLAAGLQPAALIAASVQPIEVPAPTENNRQPSKIRKYYPR